jgi:hypothetical protein
MRPFEKLCFLIAALTVIALIAQCVGAAEIIVEPRVAPYTLVDVSAPVDGTGYLWWVLGPREDSPMERWVPTGPLNKSIAFTGPPGKYMIMLAVQLPGGGLDQGFAQVIIGVPEPTPNPPVPPIPTPPGNIEIVVIEESTNRRMETLIAIEGLRKHLAAKGIPFTPIDKDAKEGSTGQPAKWLQPLLQKVQGETLPQLLIVTRSENGSLAVVAGEALPKTAELAVQTVDKYLEASK